MTSPAESWRDSPTAWFAALERALEDGNSRAAARARRELDRLGVHVRFRRKARKPDTIDASLHNRGGGNG